ncbi:hypothetical protein BIWAKO_02342 [Bosea sp. BIWAKO-01]|nr:hypothetical protein BIWAKO_02342 [Bosea sp. BIWAKO-01]
MPTRLVWMAGSALAPAGGEGPEPRRSVSATSGVCRSSFWSCVSSSGRQSQSQIP